MIAFAIAYMVFSLYAGNEIHKAREVNNAPKTWLLAGMWTATFVVFGLLLTGV